MAIIVETGSGSASSETFCSVAYADTWHANRGAAPWATLTLAQKEEALRRASDYLEQVYGRNFHGRRINSMQALSWPRTGAELDGSYIALNVIPSLVINASAELAYKAAQGNLAADIKMRVKRRKVGPIETEYDSTSAPYTRYRAIDNMLSPLLTFTNSGAWKPVARV